MRPRRRARWSKLPRVLDGGGLWATVRAWNAPSFRVLEKIGFERSERVTKDAERGDSIWMTMRLDQAPA
jgi:RimJ/RimL family protein N-acetyltransferase